MNQEEEIKKLASSLKLSGVASSMMDAMEKAKDIILNSKKTMQNIDDYNSRFNSKENEEVEQELNAINKDIDEVDKEIEEDDREINEELKDIKEIDSKIEQEDYTLKSDKPLNELYSAVEKNESDESSLATETTNEFSVEGNLEKMGETNPENTDADKEWALKKEETCEENDDNCPIEYEQEAKEQQNDLSGEETEKVFENPDNEPNTIPGGLGDLEDEKEQYDNNMDDLIEQQAGKDTDELIANLPVNENEILDEGDDKESYPETPEDPEIDHAKKETEGLQEPQEKQKNNSVLDEEEQEAMIKGIEEDLESEERDEPSF
jgi:hypothetical protein